MANKKKKKASDDKDLVPVETMNRKLWLVVFGIAVFFTFMYISKLIMPSRASKLEFGPISDTGGTFMVSSWVWNKNSKTMEIVYSIEGRYTLSDNISSRIGVKTNSGDKRHDGQLVYASEDTVVMRYENIESNGTEFEVRLTVGSSEPHFFNNKNEIEIVETLTDRSEIEYRIMSRTTVLNYYENLIESKNEEIRNNEELIADKENDIESLKSNTEYKTQTQLDSIESSIKRLNTDIESIQGTIMQLQKEIDEYEERAENLRKEISEINGND